MILMKLAEQHDHLKYNVSEITT